MNRTLSMLLWSLALAGSTVSCGDNLVDPKLPSGATQFTPPAVYTTWWEMTKACSGRPGSLDAVTWYEVPANVPLESDGRPVSAYWSAASNQIVLSASVVRNGQVVRHEMLHALLRAKGHSREDFLKRCAGYVACTTQCVADAGPAPVVPASVERVGPSTMEVTMEIAPVPVLGWINEGHFTVTLRARNPAPREVYVVLPRPANDHPRVSFGYGIFGPSFESDLVLALDDEAGHFAAGESKLHVFDFFVGNGNAKGYVSPGRYNVTGTFGGQRAPDQSIEVQ